MSIPWPFFQVWRLRAIKTFFAYPQNSLPCSVSQKMFKFNRHTKKSSRKVFFGVGRREIKAKFEIWRGKLSLNELKKKKNSLFKLRLWQKRKLKNCEIKENLSLMCEEKKIEIEFVEFFFMIFVSRWLWNAEKIELKKGEKLFNSHCCVSQIFGRRQYTFIQVKTGLALPRSLFTQNSSKFDH